MSRPASAFGHRPSPAALIYDEYMDDAAAATAARTEKRRSLTRSRRDSANLMPPPPPRPKSTRPSVSLSRQPPPSAAVASRGYPDEAFQGDGGMFHDVLAPRHPYDYGAAAAGAAAAAARQHHRSQSIYDDAVQYVQPAVTVRSRRNSMYGASATQSPFSPAVLGNVGYEEQVAAAATYQDTVSGGPTLPLTAEHLRKASRNGSGSGGSGGGGTHYSHHHHHHHHHDGGGGGGGVGNGNGNGNGNGVSRSRSTRSSTATSRGDENSDYRHTSSRTSNDEDITIKVMGPAVLKVGDAEIQCQDNTEINIGRGGAGGGTSSDKASSVHVDDRRNSRLLERQNSSGRTRASSQAGSYTRTMPQYDVYGRYGYR